MERQNEALFAYAWGAQVAEGPSWFYLVPIGRGARHDYRITPEMAQQLQQALQAARLCCPPSLDVEHEFSSGTTGNISVGEYAEVVHILGSLALAWTLNGEGKQLDIRHIKNFITIDLHEETES